ncbi:MAG: hypothetical protein WKF37_18250 [Bryobacteraceae bacterium]
MGRSAQIQAVSGSVDQAAGIVWRYRDPNNYYIVRTNALENNIVLYKVENGERKSLAPKGKPSRTYGVKHPVPKQTWRIFRVTFQGNLHTVYLNGTKLFDVEDGTFGQAGKVGLPTKADSVTHFDDFSSPESRTHDEVDHKSNGQSRPSRLSLPDPQLHRSGSKIHIFCRTIRIDLPSGVPSSLVPKAEPGHHGKPVLFDSILKKGLL